jgi:hypothetical protein
VSALAHSLQHTGIGRGQRDEDHHGDKKEYQGAKTGLPQHDHVRVDPRQRVPKPAPASSVMTVEVLQVPFDSAASLSLSLV